MPALQRESKKNVLSLNASFYMAFTSGTVWQQQWSGLLIDCDVTPSVCKTKEKFFQ